MNILQAVKDKNVFRPFLQDKNGSIKTWNRWLVALRCLYGLPVTKSQNVKLVRECTGRDASKLPPDGFQTCLFLVGRRGGKSRSSAIIAAFEAALSGREKLLSTGERGLVVCVAPSKQQAGIVLGYLKGLFESTPLLQNEIVQQTRDGLVLKNGVEIWVLSASWRTTRGYSCLATILDEVCFLGTAVDSEIKSDTALVRAIRPGLATTKGRLIAISSPYAERGWAYQQWKKCWGNDSARTLVWRAPSLTMNPSLDPAVVQDALEEDLASAKSEYLAEWRDDISLLAPREVVEACVVKGRRELLPQSGVPYSGFVDVSGGRSDSASLAIAHKEQPTAKIVLDLVREYKAPFSPSDVIDRMSQTLANYRIRMVTGDNYSAEFAVQEFKRCGIGYRKSEKNKSQLYLELLPRICSGGVALLDDETLINQLCGLERRCRSGGRDSVDHGSGGHDDVANAVAGVVDVIAKPVKRCGTWGDGLSKWGSNPRERLLRELISKNATVSMLES